ncbi:ABC transporter ATP-binding protein [Blautia sp. An249]|uniref:ABC transporter ATP-binding protein n=1 Tax=Blautia sp. An249 TaxID=1965603 RepID=UPI000B36B443|nr:dipeptide/oligopeptide/nickel ABC transporter ATP-binding protein [Blautia sp. An249]OUO81251.1 ABC transporter ATP-binding protein [Blautia sp. An249]
MEPLLEVKNLTKVFEGRKQEEFAAVNQVSFSLYPHETLGIVGESGSGKSTVVKAITRLIDVSEGELLLHGQDITHVKGKKLREAYRRFQMVFQSAAGSFDPRRTLGDGIGESLRNSGISRKETKERVKELLMQCGLPKEYADRYPHEVSGGQCQRAAIARALAIRPEILICDEATSALDVTVQKQIIQLLKNLQKTYGMSYLFICHDLALVQLFCDRVLVMQEGRIVEEGTPNEIIMHPQTDYTKQLVEAVL